MLSAFKAWAKTKARMLPTMRNALIDAVPRSVNILRLGMREFQYRHSAMRRKPCALLQKRLA